MAPRPPEIDAEWLAEVVRERAELGGASLAALEVEHVGSFTTEIWRVRLRYDGRAPDAPHSLVLKCEDPERARAGGEGFALELRFYRELAAEAPVRVPRFFAGREGPPAQLWIEDVAGLRSFSFLDGADARHARIGLEALARLHAHWWRDTDALDWVPSLEDERLLGGWQDEFDRGWHARRGFFSQLAPGFAPVGDALVGRLAATLAPLAAPATLLHGDAHGENLPLVERGNDVAFLDWAAPRRGSPAFDVAVFNAMSLPVERRRREERALVDGHAEALAAAGAELPEPWRAYRLGLLRRAARIVEIAHTFRGPNAERALRMVAERCLTAAADLDAGELVA